MALATEVPTSGVLAPEERSVVSGSGELLLAAKIEVTRGDLTSMFVGWIRREMDMFCSFLKNSDRGR